jgi:predicted RNase H-like HicB family nuclease
MKFVIIIEQDEDGVFVVERPSISVCISQGKRIRSLIKY